jgi:hypothetical protein
VGDFSTINDIDKGDRKMNAIKLDSKIYTVEIAIGSNAYFSVSGIINLDTNGDYAVMDNIRCIANFRIEQIAWIASNVIRLENPIDHAMLYDD